MTVVVVMMTMQHQALAEQLTGDLAALGKRCQDLQAQLQHTQGKYPIVLTL